MACNRPQLGEFSEHVVLTRTWVYHFVHRLKLFKRKATTSKTNTNQLILKKLKKAFLDEVNRTVTMEEIPPESIFNWDQTDIQQIPVFPWTMEQTCAT